MHLTKPAPQTEFVPYYYFFHIPSFVKTISLIAKLQDSTDYNPDRAISLIAKTGFH